MPESSAKSHSGDSWLQDVFKQELSLDLTQLRWTGAAGERIGEQIRQVLQQKVRKTVDPETGDATYEYTPAAAYLVAPGEGWRDAATTALESRGKLLVGDALAALDLIVPLGQGEGAAAVEPLKNAMGESLRALREEFGGAQLEPVLKELFQRLLGDSQDADDQGLVGRLQSDAGLVESNFYSAEDEAVLTAFYTLKDNLGCLRDSWQESLEQQQKPAAGYRIARLATAITCGRETVEHIQEVLEEASFSNACLDLLSFCVQVREETEGHALEQIERTLGDVIGLAERGLASALETIRDNGVVGLEAVKTLIANIRDEVGYLHQALREEAVRRTPATAATEPCASTEDLWKSLLCLVNALSDVLADLDQTDEKKAISAAQSKRIRTRFKDIHPAELKKVEKEIRGLARAGDSGQQADEPQPPFSDLPFSDQVLEELVALVGRFVKQLDFCQELIASENQTQDS